MTKSVPYCDVIREVGVEGDPPLTIKPDPDAPADYVLLSTEGEKAKEYWGPVHVSMSKPLAAMLGRALIAAAEGTL